MHELSVTPIGQVHCAAEETYIEIYPEYRTALEGLSGFGHINVIWWFSRFDSTEMRNVLTVPKPYKTAPETLGIFATRSTVRPNPLALTAAQILYIDEANGRIHLAYIDAEDKTPVLDIKPYTPSIDRVETPSLPAWCSHWPASLEESGEFDWEKEFSF